MAFTLFLIAILVTLTYAVAPWLHWFALSMRAHECAERDYSDNAPNGGMVALKLLTGDHKTCEIVTLDCGNRVLEDAFDAVENRLLFTPHTRDRATLLAYAAAAHEVGHAVLHHHGGFRGALNWLTNAPIVYNLAIALAALAVSAKVILDILHNPLFVAGFVAHATLTTVATAVAVAVFIELDASWWGLRALSAPKEETAKMRRLLQVCAVGVVLQLLKKAAPIIVIAAIPNLF